ncbi:MAG: hypothetical protein JWO89_3697 [Verrucomicrobiaceae bacterium]|nr:hypothetical protein [Verrucomicrobiaceae bacterium]
MRALLFLTLLVPSLAIAQAKAPPAAIAVAEPATKGLRVFTCAHSFHAFVYPLLTEMAKGAGITDHQPVGISSIGGSRVIQHWEANDPKHQAKEALTTGKVDVLTLSPIWLPDEGIEKFAALGLEHNPNIRVTVNEFWLPNDEYVPVYPLQTRKKVDHNATDLSQLRKAQTDYDRDMDKYCAAINTKLGKTVLYTVPVGTATLALREKVVAGQAAGIKTQAELFRDNWGHPEAPLRVIAGYCHFAVIYHRTPVGLPVPVALAKAPGMTPESAQKLNTLLQELAWDAVVHHEMSGVKDK